MTPQGLQLQAPSFDELASACDTIFTRSALGRCLRTPVRERLEGVLGGDRRGPEVGCGMRGDAAHCDSPALADEGFRLGVAAGA